MHLQPNKINLQDFHIIKKSTFIVFMSTPASNDTNTTSNTKNANNSFKVKNLKAQLFTFSQSPSH